MADEHPDDTQQTDTLGQEQQQMHQEGADMGPGDEGHNAGGEG